MTKIKAKYGNVPNKLTWVMVALIALLLIMAIIGIIKPYINDRLPHYGYIEPQLTIEPAPLPSIDKAKIYLDARETFAGYLNNSANFEKIIESINRSLADTEKKDFYGFDYAKYSGGSYNIFHLDESQFAEDSLIPYVSGAASIYHPNYSRKAARRLDSSKNNPGCIITVMNEIRNSSGVSVLITSDFSAFSDNYHHTEMENSFYLAAQQKALALFRFDEYFQGKTIERGLERSVSGQFIHPMYVIVFGDDWETAVYADNLATLLDENNVPYDYLISGGASSISGVYTPDAQDYIADNVYFYGQGKNIENNIIVRNLLFDTQDMFSDEPLVFKESEDVLEFAGEKPLLLFGGKSLPPLGIIGQNLTIHRYGLNNVQLYKVVKTDSTKSHLEELPLEKDFLDISLEQVADNQYEQRFALTYDHQKIKERMIAVEFDVTIEDFTYSPANWIREYSGYAEGKTERLEAIFGQLFENDFEDFVQELTGKKVAHYRLVFTK